MIYGIIISIISFLLDAFLSNYIPISITNNNILIPMFTLVSLIIILPYFNNDDGNYLKICVLFGLLYDLTFTNTLGPNTALFLLVGYITIFMNNGLSNSLVSLIIKLVVSIVIYNILLYLILVLLDYMDYGIISLGIKILKSLLLNCIYLVVLYFSTNIIAKKLHIKKSI